MPRGEWLPDLHRRYSKVFRYCNPSPEPSTLTRAPTGKAFLHRTMIVAVSLQHAIDQNAMRILPCNANHPLFDILIRALAEHELAAECEAAEEDAEELWRDTSQGCLHWLQRHLVRAF